MKVTILLLAFAVAGFVEQAGHPKIAWLIMIAAFAEFLYETWWLPWRAKRKARQTRNALPQ